MSSDSVDGRVRTERRQLRYAATLVLGSYLLTTYIELKAQITGMHFDNNTVVMSKILRFMPRTTEGARPQPSQRSAAISKSG